MSPDAAPELTFFRAAIGSTFSVPLDGAAPAELILVEVAESDRHPGWESFSLLFEGPVGALTQGTYAVDHRTSGSFGLFLVPIQSPADKQRYEAVFNRQIA
jgi:hypothetical protein